MPNRDIVAEVAPAASMSVAARRFTLVMLTAIYGFGFIDRIVIALVAEQVKADFHISDLEIGLLGGTAFALVNTLAALPLARLAERKSRKWVSACSLLVGSVFTMACGAAGSFLHMVIARFGMAAGSAGTEAPPHSMISDMYSPERRASAMALFMLGVPLAALVGSSVAGSIAQAYGWRMAFYVIGATGVAVALLALAFTREPRRQGMVAASSPPMSMRQVLSAMLGDRCLRHILIGLSIVSLAAFGINTFLPSFFARNYALGVAEVGVAFGTLSGVASALGTVIGGYGSEWFARRDARLLVAAPGLGAMLGAPIFIAGLCQDQLIPAFCLMLVGSTFFYMAMGPAIAALHSILDSRSRATGSAIFLMIMYLVGQGLGPPLAGLISDAVAGYAYSGSDYTAACTQALAPQGGAACAEASAMGITFAIAISASLYVWAGTHLLWAARHRSEAGQAG